VGEEQRREGVRHISTNAHARAFGGGCGRWAELRYPLSRLLLHCLTPLASWIAARLKAALQNTLPRRSLCHWARTVALPWRKHADKRRAPLALGSGGRAAANSIIAGVPRDAACLDGGWAKR